MSTESIQVPFIVDLVAGAIGGVTGTIVGHPFDTVKVKLQTMPYPFPGEQPHYIGSIDCARKVIRSEGFFRGLYKGIWPPILSGTPINAVCFFGYGIGKRLFTPDKDNRLTFVEYFVAGMVSGFSCVAIMTPTERVKCLQQINDGNYNGKGKMSVGKGFKGTIDCILKLIKEEGILKGPFKGITITAVREVPGSGAYFISYEWFRLKLAERRFSESNNICISGGLAGVVYWLVAMPFDTVKSRIQTNNKCHKMFTVMHELIRREGFTALYRGADAVLIRAFPVNAIIFYTYEITVKLCLKLFP